MSTPTRRGWCLFFCRVPKGPGVFKGGGNWGTLRIPFGKIGED